MSLQFSVPLFFFLKRSYGVLKRNTTGWWMEEVSRWEGRAKGDGQGGDIIDFYGGVFSSFLGKKLEGRAPAPITVHESACDRFLRSLLMGLVAEWNPGRIVSKMAEYLF